MSTTCNADALMSITYQLCGEYRSTGAVTFAGGSEEGLRFAHRAVDIENEERR